MSDENFDQVEEIVEDDVSTEETTDSSITEAVKKTTKSAVLAQAMGYLANMRKEELSSFLEKTMSMGDKDNKEKEMTEKNASSVTMREDVLELFSGQDDLSEEFKTEASTLFEAAVQNRVVLEVARLEEESDVKLEEQVTASIDQLHDQVNTYMDYVVEKWMEQNEVTLENNFRVEATESFIDGLKNLFSESYVVVPEEKVDLVSDLETHVAELEESLESVSAEMIELNKVISEAHIEAAFCVVSEGLADTQIEKLRTLTESIEHDSVEEYVSKLEIVKKQYFSESIESDSTGFISEESSVGSNDEPEVQQIVPEEMKGYFAAISKTNKR